MPLRREHMPIFAPGTGHNRNMPIAGPGGASGRGSSPLLGLTNRSYSEEAAM